MNERGQTQKGNYAADQIKAARARRGPSDPAKIEAYKLSKEIQAKILEAIADQALTVPEIAEATNLTTSQVWWWITGFRKYGMVQDEGKRGDYIAYRRK